MGDREKPFQLRNAEDQGSISHQDIVLQLCTQITYATYGPLPGKIKVQGSCLFVTYTIIQGIISSEM